MPCRLRFWDESEASIGHTDGSVSTATLPNFDSFFTEIAVLHSTNRVKCIVYVIDNAGVKTELNAGECSSGAGFSTAVFTANTGQQIIGFRGSWGTSEGLYDIQVIYAAAC